VKAAAWLVVAALAAGCTAAARGIVRDDPKEPGAIQDIGRLPKIAQTPAWKKQDPTRSGDIKDGSGLKDRSGFKEPPVVTAGKGGPEGRDRTTGASPSKPGAAVPKIDRSPKDTANVPAKVVVDNTKPAVPQAKVPVHESKPSTPQAKVPVHDSKPSGPVTKSPVVESRSSLPRARVPVDDSRSSDWICSAK